MAYYSASESNEQHIMISYQWDSQDMCICIKNELEKRLNRKVWIDLENMRGHTMQAMANAIEQASCVLICMTSKYSQSKNCKYEADYVVQQNKPYVPLLMEKDYKPKGWYKMKLYCKDKKLNLIICLNFIKVRFNVRHKNVC